jgi:hypothetical protein
MPPGSASCGGSSAALGKRFAQYAVVDGEFATAPFPHTVGDLGLRVVARLKDNLAELFTAARRRFPCGPPTTVFPYEQDRVEIWEAGDWRIIRATQYRRADRQRADFGANDAQNGCSTGTSVRIGDSNFFRITSKMDDTHVSRGVFTGILASAILC